jgi:hypothetical protein
MRQIRLGKLLNSWYALWLTAKIRKKKSRKEDLEKTRSKLQIQNPVNLSVTGKEEGCV